MPWPLRLAGCALVMMSICALFMRWSEHALVQRWWQRVWLNAAFVGALTACAGPE